MKIIREFKCAMTGTDCVVVLESDGQEYCYEKWEYNLKKKEK